MNQVNEEKLSAILKANDLIREFGIESALRIAEYMERTELNQNFWQLVKQNISK